MYKKCKYKIYEIYCIKILNTNSTMNPIESLLAFLSSSFLVDAILLFLIVKIVVSSPLPLLEKGALVSDLEFKSSF